MKTTLTMIAFLTTVPAAVFADDDCSALIADWQPREAVIQLASQNAWTVRRIKIDDGCYEIDGRDAAGRKIEVNVHPATLEVIEFEFEYEDDDDDDGDDDRDATAPPVISPPANGLFGNGAAPQVEMH